MGDETPAIPPFPNYARSSHPEVLEAVRETIRRHDEYKDRVCDFAEKITGNRNAGYSSGWMFEGISMTGFDTEAVRLARPSGKWKKPQGSMIVPFKNNPVYDEMREIRYKAAHIPGRGNLIWGVGRFGTGTIFEFDGYVYSGITFELARSDRYDDWPKYGWEEIKTSEFHHAMEQENDNRSRIRGTLND